MTDLFTGMSEFQNEIVYKYGEISVKIKRYCADEYSIDIDCRDWNLHNGYSNGNYNNFMKICNRLEFNNEYIKNGYWFMPDYYTHLEDGDFKNGDIFNVKQINYILKAVKNTAEFIERNGGTIKDRKEEVYYAGKMKITLIPINGNKVRIKIEGMKCWNNTPSGYHDPIYNTKCYVGLSGDCSIYSNKQNNWIVYLESPDNIIRSHEKAMEIVECLKECSDRLHEMNEPTPGGISSRKGHEMTVPSKEKMKIKVTQTENDKVILEITGMKDSIFPVNGKYRSRCNIEQNRIILKNDFAYFVPDGCDIDRCNVILLGKDHPMTKQAVEEIITFLGASAAKLHAINHKNEDYELVL